MCPRPARHHHFPIITSPPSYTLPNNNAPVAIAYLHQADILITTTTIITTLILSSIFSFPQLTYI